ncbi:hypothetical protein M422DRAFT_30434 [Sphaerobolus stellatus SS14]|uniref:Indoleamine 2,3-dioxygenase n=1 Tax=Sphaerobolus stellatus (strain SS14) TaxID=990650 RepID=A0A0C9W066_SPHS4|nr:hypothetical protein M422DRAFT_30434 [Sphaerobolus stellatus SS14]
MSSSFASFALPGASLLSYYFSYYFSRASKLDDDFLDRPLVDISRLSDFDMNISTGFMPLLSPLDRLPHHYDLWETALSLANTQVSLGEDQSPEAHSRRESSSLWRQRLQNAPTLDVDPLLRDVRYLQRAHHVLAFLVHFYVHSIPPPPVPERIVVPASLAVPLVAVSDALGIAPILTFADTVLWNWELKDPSQAISPENMRCKTMFSNTPDEENFYVCCANIELRGVEALGIIMDYTRSSLDDTESISHINNGLDRLTGVVEELTTILQSVRSTCEPHVFYFQIRPWFRGSDAEGVDSPGWIYEGVDPNRHLELSGPSAGQSSIMHALDIFLDVDHNLTKPRVPAPSEQNRRADQSFMIRMRNYMPGKHQDFLRCLSAQRPIRELAKRIPELRESYDGAVLALKRFRDQHMRIACLYIVTMSRTAAARAAGCPMGAAMQKLQRENESVRQPVRGTGGNELSCLLKASRDATKRTLIAGNIN